MSLKPIDKHYDTLWEAYVNDRGDKELLTDEGFQEWAEDNNLGVFNASL